MAFDAGRERQFRVVGQRVERPDGIEKVTGKALYGADMTAPGMLFGRILRSPHAHAKIVSSDTSRAEAMPGVHAVITGADLPIKYGVIPWTPDETALATDKVRFIGDEVAAVAAIDALVGTAKHVTAASTDAAIDFKTRIDDHVAGERADGDGEVLRQIIGQTELRRAEFPSVHGVGNHVGNVRTDRFAYREY